MAGFRLFGGQGDYSEGRATTAESSAGDVTGFTLEGLTTRGVKRLSLVALPTDSRPTYRAVALPTAKSPYPPRISRPTHRVVAQLVALPTEN